MNMCINYSFVFHINMIYRFFQICNIDFFYFLMINLQTISNGKFINKKEIFKQWKNGIYTQKTEFLQEKQ